MKTLDPDELIACPVCDALYRDETIEGGYTARCTRCGTVLAAPKGQAMTRMTMLALAALVLMVGAVAFPFLELSARGLQQKSSVIDAVLAFSTGLTTPLSLIVAFLIVLLPVLRLVALVYVLAPMSFGYQPWPHAAVAFRFAEVLRPWAMAEIFVVGVAVALVKVAGLASVTLGPAFWAFCLLVVITVIKDNMMCRYTLWKTLIARIPS